MDSAPTSPHRPVLGRLAADAVRLCRAREAVLTCGTQLIARAGTTPSPRCAIAKHPFGAGAEAYELILFDVAARALTEHECGALHALTEAFQRELGERPAVTPPRDAGIVRDRLAVALDYVTDAFALLGVDWTVEHVNTQFERTFACRRDAVVGRDFWQSLPQLAGTRFEAETRAAMGGTLPRTFDEHSAPLQRWLQWRAFPCQEGLAVLTTDISDRKIDEATRVDVEQKLLQAQRMESLGTIAGGVAHEFNNVLGAILGHVGLLGAAVRGDGAAAESVDQIRVAAERARELVRQILAYSRSSPREFERQPLQPLLAESLGLLRSTLPASVRLDVALTDEPLAATVDPSEVQQVLMNLCTNAWQALPAGGGVVGVQLERVELGEPARADVGKLAPGLYACLAVTDAGSGVDERARNHLFEPFFTTKPRGHGTGLGLHVVKNIVLAHGGAICVDTAPGRGSRFEVWLPAAPTTEVEPAVEPPAPALLGRGERVACVDDDPVVLLMVQRVLERAGFAVTAFDDPHALVDAFAGDAGAFDLLVTDYSMPGMNGLEVAGHVRARCAGIPVIIATGFASDELRQAVEALGGAEILNKENTFEELGERAARALAAAR